MIAFVVMLGSLLVMFSGLAVMLGSFLMMLHGWV